jgi:putative transposase
LTYGRLVLYLFFRDSDHVILWPASPALSFPVSRITSRSAAAGASRCSSRAGDQEVYRDLLAEQAVRARVAIWAYSLMPNNAQLVAVPEDEAGLGRAIGEAGATRTSSTHAGVGCAGRGAAHLGGADDAPVTVKPVLDRLDPAALAVLQRPGAVDHAVFAALRGAETTGCPLGNEDFIKGLERLLGRPVARRAPGRKPATPEADQPTLL